MKLVGILFLLLYSAACGSDTAKHPMSDREIEDKLIEFNQNTAAFEEKIIERYISEHELSMNKTGTGLWYTISDPGHGDTITQGQVATIDFEVLLLNDSVCYSSYDKKPYTFKVGMADIETGIHEGMTYLQEGSKSIFILPSHLAHGLSGDNNKIPPKTPVIYKIHVLKVQ